MGKQYYSSPLGIGRYTWVNKPDTKFNSDGVFKTDLMLEGDVALEMKAKIDVQVEEALNAYTEDMKPVDRKKWSPYHPYEVEEDDDGNPTGRIFFKFRQNAVIKLKDGTTKKVVIGIYDASDKASSVQVYSGSKMRVRYSMRAIPLKSSKEVGIRLDFFMVQVVELAGRSESGGFGAVEGGYVDDHEDDETGDANQEENTNANDGDY